MRGPGACALLALVLVLVPRGAPAREDAIAVIVHPSRRDVVDVADLERIYLGKRRFWGDGVPIVAFNLPAETVLRERFSMRVLHQTSSRLASYWNERYFHGMFPPAVLASADAVKRYVATDPKAIGYVSAAEADASVRIVLTLE